MHLRRFHNAPRPAGTIVFLLTLAFIVGCDAVPIAGDLNASRPTTELVSGAMPPSKSSVLEDADRNNAFEEAQPATMAASGTIVIQGSIDSQGDIDVYALGPASRGDRITIRVTGNNGLNTVAALFDGYTDLIDANDDRSFYGGLVDPYISRVVRYDTANLFVGIAVSTAAHFASTEGRYDSGTYSISVERQPGAQVVEAKHQLVYMDFEGGESVQIGLEPVAIMRPFSAESISGRLTGKTEYLIDLIIDHMKRDFADYNVTLLDSRHHERPGEPHSRLFFGNFNSRFLGLADNVDTFNSFQEQEAIIYAEDIGMYENLLPSAEEVALSLANIGSHELGHLLGLEHSGETQDVMATAASARQILEIDAGFDRTRMQSAVFPIGVQNGPTLLIRNVGANPAGSSARWRIEDSLPQIGVHWRDEAGLEDIHIVSCGRCASGSVE